MSPKVRSESRLPIGPWPGTNKGVRVDNFRKGLRGGKGTRSSWAGTFVPASKTQDNLERAQWDTTLTLLGKRWAGRSRSIVLALFRVSRPAKSEHTSSEFQAESRRK